MMKQTNRTMLFEEMNPQKPDLLTLVGDVRGVDSLSDEKIKEINEALLVENFDEFLIKFEPIVYSFFNANTQKIMYTLEKPENIPEEMLSPIRLNRQNDFLKILMSLIEAKASQSFIHVNLQFDKLTDMISPKKVMEDIKQNRKELQYAYKVYAQLEDGDPRKLDMGDKLNVMFEETSIHYNNVLAMLPLAIEDIKTRLLLGTAEEKKDNTPLALGILSMDEKGELKVLEVPKGESTELMVVDDQVNAGLIAALEENYEVLNEEKSDYVKGLVIRTYCPLASTMVNSIDIQQEVDNYNSYLEFYQRAKDDFIKVVKPLIEKILGVWAFFEQYPANLKGMRPSLFVTNISNDMLLKSSNLPRFITFLNTVNSKNDFCHTIWYGIVPSLSLDKNSSINLTRQRFQGNEKVEKSGINTLESLMRLLDVLKDYSVQCFFSYETGDKTTFNQMATEGIDSFEDRCISLTGKAYSEFAIPCIPNFTIIPKEKSGVILDKRMFINENNVAELSQKKEDIMKLRIDGVYIGAAYIAAGLVGAYQCPKYLKECFKRNVDEELPGVRFDIEAGDHPLKVHTVMAKEITGFTNAIKNEMNRRSFGFVFSSENAVLNGENIDHIMVYKARNLMSDGKVYEPIYKTQATTYMERVLRHTTGDYKKENIVRFFSNNPSSQKSKWQEKRNCVNGILGAGDDIEYEIDEANGYCTLKLTFNGNVKNLEIEINPFNSENRAI